MDVFTYVFTFGLNYLLSENCDEYIREYICLNSTFFVMPKSREFGAV